MSAILGIVGLALRIIQAVGRSSMARENGRVLIVIDEVRVKKDNIEDFID